MKKISLITGTESEKRVLSLLQTLYDHFHDYDEIYYFSIPLSSLSKEIASFFLKAPIGFSDKRVSDTLSSYYYSKYLENKKSGFYYNLQEGREIIQLLNIIPNKQEELNYYSKLIKGNHINKLAINVYLTRNRISIEPIQELLQSADWNRLLLLSWYCSLQRLFEVSLSGLDFKAKSSRTEIYFRYSMILFDDYRLSLLLWCFWEATKGHKDSTGNSCFMSSCSTILSHLSLWL